MRAFILAGGFATRLWPLTEKRAKPLLPLAGKPLISHLVEKIPNDIPVTVSTNAAFAEGFGEWKKSVKRPVELVIEKTHRDDHKLGALGAVAQWVREEKIDDDLLLLTGDNYMGFSMDTFLRAATPDTPLLAAFDIQSKERAQSLGTVILAKDGKTIEAFEEKPKEPKTTLVSTGCSLLPASTLPVLLEFARHHPDNVGGIFEELLRHKRRVECFTFTEPWMDIGSFASYLEAHRLLVGHRVIQEEGAEMRESHCHGSVALGAHTIVERSELTDCMLFDGCHIVDCTLRDCIIDQQCHLEGVDLKNQMIRENTVLVVGE